MCKDPEELVEPKKSHGAADAMDWDEAMSLIQRLYEDGKIRESMLIASGCFLGLRISDMLTLKWEDVCSGDKETSKVEKKTGKSRSIRFNKHYSEHAMKCWNALGNPENTYILNSQKNFGKTHMTRQCAAQILDKIKDEYQIKSAKTFSAHSLRKTFGRRVWNQECKKGRGEMALMLLSDVFNHSNVNITKRYLGIRKDEILSVYDSLEI